MSAVPSRWYVALLATCVFAACAGCGGCGYNRIQELQERARGARSEIEVQLQRKVDLVPNLLETVRAYVSLDDEVVTAVADARAWLARVMRSGELEAMEEGNAELSGAITRMLDAVALYSALQADPSYQLLLSQLNGTGQQIAAAGRDYNEAVWDYNAYIKAFPEVLTARVIGAAELQSFHIWEAGAAGTPAGE